LFCSDMPEIVLEKYLETNCYILHFLLCADMPEIVLEQDLETSGCILQAFFTCSVQAFPPAVVSSCTVKVQSNKKCSRLPL
jgi:hypothetical protein